MRPLVVLLHGLGSGRRSWDPVAAALGADAEVLAPDLPGYGGAPGPFGLDAAVGRVSGQLAGRRAHICGLSAGAVVALRLAARHPELVQSLILTAVQVRPPRVLTALQTAMLRLIPARNYRSQEDPEVSKAAVLGALRELSGLDLRPDLGLVRARTLVVCGAKDRANLPASRQAAAGIDGAGLRLIPGAGHTWNETHPVEFAQLIRTFCRPTGE